MKLIWRGWYLEMQSKVPFYFINRTTKKTKVVVCAWYAYPFCIIHPHLYKDDSERLVHKRKIVHNGIRINFMQQLELFFILFYLQFILERVYFLSKGYTVRQSLYAVSFQREIQSNMHADDYVQNRKRFSHLQYVWKKSYPPVTKVASGGQILID